MNVNVCSFCNKHKDQVQNLIVSETVAICNECINLCQELLQDPVDEVKPSSDNFHDPKQIKSFLENYILENLSPCRADTKTMSKDGSGHTEAKSPSSRIVLVFSMFLYPARISLEF